MELPGRGPAKHGVHGALLSKIFVFITPGENHPGQVCFRTPGLLRSGRWFPSYSPRSTQVHRHEVLALRFQSLSSVTFEGCLHSVARTRQARLVVPPEPFDAIFCKRVFRVLLQLPTRDQVLTAFVYIQNDRQHRRPSVHFHPPSLLSPFTVFPPLCLERSQKTSAVFAVSSPSVLLGPPRSAGGEPPWPDPQRWRGGPGGYPASAPLR